MTKKLIATAALIVLCTGIFTGCTIGKEKRTFEPAGDPVTVATLPAAKEVDVSYDDKKFTLLNCQMGFSSEQTRKAAGLTQAYISGKNKYYTSQLVKDLPGLNADTELRAFFILNTDGKLYEIQYAVQKQLISLKSVQDRFDTAYGRGVNVKDKNQRNARVYRVKDVYAVITDENGNEFIVSFYESNYFETVHTEEVKAFKAAKR